jgi:hypothetical protein
VQDNLPTNVFSIDIPFKRGQSHSNMRSKVTAVSYLHSGVNDSTVHVTAVSMTPLCSQVNFPYKKQCVELFAKIFEKIWLHSVVNDTAVPVTAVSMTPLCTQLCRLSSRIRSHIRKGFNLCIRDPGEVVWWTKNRGRKSRVRVPLKNYFLLRFRNTACSWQKFFYVSLEGMQVSFEHWHFNLWQRLGE